MIGRVLIVFLLIFTAQSTVCAQDNFAWKLFPHKDSLIARYDTSWIDPMLDQITLRVYGGYKGNELQIDDSFNSTQVFSANSKFQLGVGFGYRWLILNTSIVSPFNDSYGEEKGDPFSFDSQVNVYGNKFQLDLRVQWIDGYYKKTTNEIYTNFNNQAPFELRSDMKMRALSGGIYHSLNKKYSHKHAFDQTKMMKRSGGTFLGGVRASYLTVFSDSALFERNQGLQDTTTQIESFTMTAAVGGAYTFLFNKNWFITGHATLNFSGQNVVLFGRSGLIKSTISGSNIVFSATGRAAFGYNSKSHYVGLYAVVDASPGNGLYGGEINQYFTSIKMIYAYRFSTASFRKLIGKK